MMATPLFPTFDKRISDAVNALITIQVIPWIFLAAGPPFHVKRFDGREISYQGGTFDGSRQIVFWGGYIEPFLEDLVGKELTFAVTACNERNVDARKALLEVQGLLISGCRKVFTQMAEVDRRLRGHGTPSSVPLRSVENELTQMNSFIQTHVSAQLEMCKPRRFEDWWGRNKALVGIIGLLISIVGLAVNWANGRQPKPSLKLEPPAVTPQIAPDPLLAEIKRFNDYNAAHPEVVVGVEKADDPQYNGIWNLKMGMLASIEALSKTLHREKEVEPLMELKSVIRDGSKAGPLQGKQPKRDRSTP